MRTRRGGKPDADLCSGPGKLTEALGVDLGDNEADLCREPFLLMLPAGEAPPIVAGPRIGITKAVERPWRFCAAGNPFVSRPWPDAT
ncbi:MAG: DNA-3-methyladenine glycosylase [Solirubrobacterales bacterium]|jgi:DNA-3-methyladenine glycosylase|nr:DNA-3-methyladenine glycosylase [Solirubrobacterales bacterium]